MHNPYETPGVPPHLPLSIAPPVVFWYRMYTGAMALLYAAVTVGGVAMIFFRDELVDQATTVEEIVITGVILIAMGGLFFVIFALGTFIPPRPWAWIVGIRAHRRGHDELLLPTSVNPAPHLLAQARGPGLLRPRTSRSGVSHPLHARTIGAPADLQPSPRSSRRVKLGYRFTGERSK